MRTLRDWLDRPQAVPFRRILLKVHSWLALAVGAYIVVISVSGSAVVFRRELNMWLVPSNVDASAGPRLAADALEEAIRRTYHRYEVLEIREPPRRERPVWVALARDGRTSERLFDPHAARDLGLAYPRTLRVVEWLVRLHDDLLAGEVGRRVNAVGGLALAVLTATGAVLWWPGRGRWPRSLIVPRPSRTRRFAWHLHSALGFWCGALLVIWAVTGVYFGYPEPFEATLDRFDPDPTDFHRPGEPVLLEAIRLHFGRFGGLGVRVSWTLLGLVPAVLFASGFWLWWQRRARRNARGPAEKKASRGDNADQSA